MVVCYTINASRANALWDIRIIPHGNAEVRMRVGSSGDFCGKGYERWDRWEDRKNTAV